MTDDKLSDVSSQENDVQGVNEMPDFYSPVTVAVEEKRSYERKGKEKKIQHPQNYPE